MQKLAIHKFCPGSINYDFIPADYYAAGNTFAINYSRNNIADVMDVSLNRLLCPHRK